MRKGFFVAALMAALAAAAAAFGGTSSPERAGITAGPNSADTALLRCGRTGRLGVGPATAGPGASGGAQQARWARFFVTRYTRANRRKKLRIINGDTQLPDTAQAIQVAERFASNGAILGVVGPA